MDARHLSPIGKNPGSEESMMNGLKMLTTDSEQVLNGTVSREKTLSVGHWFEPSHLAFLLTRWLMRDFSLVVLVLTGAMNNGREDIPMCS